MTTLRLREAAERMLRAGRAYMKYHKEKFYPEGMSPFIPGMPSPGPTGITPALDELEAALRAPDLQGALRQADTRCWSVCINFTGPDDGFVYADRGDSNCPRTKEYPLYDPNSGHGYEATKEEIFDDLAGLIAFLNRLPEVGTAYQPGEANDPT